MIGSVFEASYRYRDGNLVPSIRGRAWVTSQAHLVLDPDDPYAWGIR